jgi:nucleotide-binding universal stress UspA family protein
MTTKPIVAATDSSEESLRAVEWAAREAVLRGAPLRIVSAAALLPQMIERQGVSDLDTVADIMRKDRDRALAAASARAAEVAPGVALDADELTGEPAQAVTESGASALMLVVGSRGIGAFAALVLGSVSRYVAGHAPCPVLVIREETTAVHRHVGVGLGDLDQCADSLGFAFEEAALRRASLIVMHAWHVPQAEISRAGAAFPAPGASAVEAEAAERLAGLLGSWREKYPDVPVSQDVVHGHPARALIGLSALADLVVLGRHVRHPQLPGPGAVRNGVLHHAHGPVAIVPSSGAPLG